MRYSLKVAIWIGGLFLTPASEISAQSVYPPKWLFSSGFEYSICEAPNGEWVKWTRPAEHLMMRSSDLGLTWMASDSNSPKTLLTILSSGAELYTSNLYRSSSQGKSWVPIIIPNCNTITDVVYSASGRLYASHGNGLSFSRDSGISWLAGDTTLSGSGLTCIARNPLNNYLFAAGMAGVLRSTDDGLNWDVQLPPINGGSTIRRLEITATGRIYAGSYGDLYISTTNGESWYDNGHPPIDLMIAVRDSILIILSSKGGSGGLFMTTNEGDDWLKIDTFVADGESRQEQIYDIRLMSNGYLTVATETHGICRTVEPLYSERSEVSPRMIDSPWFVFPNPVMEEAHLVRGSRANLLQAEVLGVDGSRVAALSIDNSNRLNLSTLSNGPYILRIGDQVIKFSVLR